MDAVLLRPCFMLLLAIAVPGTAVHPEGNERYGFKQARIIVEKKTKNSAMESTTIDTVYIDEWGWVEVRYSYQVEEIKTIEQRRESRTVSIMEKEWLISYDPDEKKGRKMKNPFYHPTGSLSEQQGKEMGEGTAKAFEATTTAKGTEAVSGKMCEVTETRTGLQGMETVTITWMWKGLLMKSVSTVRGTEITELVTTVDEGIGVSPDLRKVPDDVEISAE